MNTYGHPHEIPFFQTAQIKKPADAYGNTPTPFGMLEMPMQWASWLYYKAKTIQTITEWTPLATGPGTRIDYSGDPAWDGSKFTIESSVLELPNPLQPTNFWWGGQYANSAAAREAIRGYDVLTTEDPSGPDWTFEKKPGQWFGVGVWYAIQFGSTQKLDLATRFDGPANWPGFQTTFTDNVANALDAWATRLSDWLQSEQEKDPQNPDLIADIQRQISVRAALATQITTSASLTIVGVENVRQSDINIGISVALADRNATQTLMRFNEGHLRWIAAEELLEAFAAAVMPINLFRANLLDYIKFHISKDYFSDKTPFNGTGTNVFDAFYGGALVSGALENLTTDAIPALCSAQLAVNLGTINRNPLLIYNPGPDYDSYTTFFESQSSEFPVSDGLTTQQAKALLTVGIGPVGIGLTSAACIVKPTRNFFYPVSVLGSMLSGLAQSVTCPTENPDCEPSNTITFNQLFTETGTNRTYSTSGIGTVDGSIAWAFQGPYTTPTGDVSGVRGLWQAAADSMQALNSAPTAAGVEVGTFRIEDLSTLGTASLPGLKIFECPLFATPGTVGGLSITWRILSVRT